ETSLAGERTLHIKPALDEVDAHAAFLLMSVIFILVFVFMLVVVRTGRHAVECIEPTPGGPDVAGVADPRKSNRTAVRRDGSVWHGAVGLGFFFVMILIFVVMGFLGGALAGAF